MRSGRIMNADTVRFERLLPGAVEEVWEYISSPTGMSRWHRCVKDFSIELKTGGRFSCTICPPPLAPGMDWQALASLMPPSPSRGHIQGPRGLVTECKPYRVLAYSFIDPACDLVSSVRFELEQRDCQVLLTFTHSQLPAEMMATVAAGWHAHLDALASLLRGEVPEDFMTVFLEQYKKYSAVIGATLVVTAAATPSFANSADLSQSALADQRTQLLNNYDRAWKDADDLKYELSILSRSESGDVGRVQNQLERELHQKYDLLHRIELDLRDLGKVLI